MLYKLEQIEIIQMNDLTATFTCHRSHLYIARALNSSAAFQIQQVC